MSPLGSRSAKKKAAAAPAAAAPAAAAPPTRAVVVEKPKANIYTVLLIMAFVAVLIGCLALYGELNAYDFKTKAVL
ncbi:MAG TPA: hypothetical protein VL175_21315 [Pirellulales bacterium]|jgi:hypothetical protein|nr:hypothetical protein [Pirellulales bacterium]